MDNRPVYTFRVDFEKCKVLDEDFSSFMDRCFKQGILFDVAVTSNGGTGFVPLNKAINLFIDDCRKEAKDRCMANPYRDEHFGDILKDFIEHYILHYWHRGELANDDQYYEFEFFKGSFTCKAFIPASSISDDVYQNYRYLGPDYLMGARGMTDEVLFHYILPALYFNLIYDDLTEKEELLRLQEYKIGLA